MYDQECIGSIWTLSSTWNSGWWQTIECAWFRVDKKHTNHFTEIQSGCGQATWYVWLREKKGALEACCNTEILDGDQTTWCDDLREWRNPEACCIIQTLSNDKLVGVFDPVHTKKHLKHVTDLEYWMVKNSWECLMGWMKKLLKQVSALRHWMMSLFYLQKVKHLNSVRALK